MKKSWQLINMILITTAALFFTACDQTGIPIDPGSTPAGIITLQAEDAYFNDGVVESEYTGYSGSGYVNTENDADTYLEWMIMASAGGSAQCRITYANGGETSRNMAIEVNGTVVVPNQAFPTTGSWENWSVSTATMYFNEGENILRFLSLDNAGAPNLDKLDISFSGSLTASKPAPANLTIHIIGDSTACNYESSLYPRMGWGQMLQTYFDSAHVKVSNSAISGRSSKSFYDEGAWTRVRNALQSGDIVLIQFGHNDEKSEDRTRYTEPYTTYQQYLTIYIRESKARGATPILVTPIHRNKWSGSSIADSHGDYPPAMRALAADQGVTLIDLHQKSRTLFESLGQNYVTYQIFMNLRAGQYPNYPTGNSDNTHLQKNGADRISGLVRDSINEQNLAIRAHLIK